MSGKKLPFRFTNQALVPDYTREEIIYLVLHCKEEETMTLHSISSFIDEMGKILLECLLFFNEISSP